MCAALAGPGAGCSFAFSSGPPAQHAQMRYFDCTSTYGLSVADGFFSLSGVSAAAMALNQSEQAYAAKNSGASRNNAAGADFVLAGVFAASAVYGIVQASRCDQAKEALEARIMRPILVPPLRGGPPPPAAFPGPAAPPPSVVLPPAPPAPVQVPAETIPPPAPAP